MGGITLKLQSHFERELRLRKYDRLPNFFEISTSNICRLPSRDVDGTSVALHELPYFICPEHLDDLASHLRDSSGGRTPVIYIKAASILPAFLRPVDDLNAHDEKDLNRYTYLPFYVMWSF